MEVRIRNLRQPVHVRRHPSDFAIRKTYLLPRLPGLAIARRTEGRKSAQDLAVLGGPDEALMHSAPSDDGRVFLIVVRGRRRRSP